jgi:hypothetical protein
MNYRSYVSRFSEVAAPLSSLTKKGVTFKWSGECNNSFLHLEKALCEAPILAYPMSKGQFILDTDASGVGYRNHTETKIRAIWLIVLVDL